MLIVVVAEAVDPTLMIYLSLDEGQGDTVKDGSGNGNDGELADGPKWVDGKFGKALEFGDRSRVHISASDSLHGNIFIDEFTMLAWIKPIAGGNQWGHVWRSVDGDDGTQCTLFYNSGGFLSWRGRLVGGWGERCVTPGGMINADEWAHTAVVGDKTDFKIYINGEEAGTAPFVEMDGDITDYYLGFDDRQWDEWFTGAIDEVYILTRAMTADEIQSALEGPMKQIISVQPAGKLAVTWGQVKVN
jgi:hypothetical protein